MVKGSKVGVVLPPEKKKKKKGGRKHLTVSVPVRGAKIFFAQKNSSGREEGYHRGGDKRFLLIY